MKQRTQTHSEIITEAFGSLWSRAIPKAGWTEFLLGSIPAANSSATTWVTDLSGFLTQTGATLVELDVFGDARLTAEVHAALAASPFAAFPASLLLNDSNGGPLAGGLLVRAVLGVAVEPVVYHGTTIGFRFEDQNAAYCYLGGLVPEDATQDGAGQTTQVMSTIKAALQAGGMVFRDVVRTWYYLDGILAWYDDFNRARTEFFKKHDVFSLRMPASTGIGIANASGKLVLAKVHAMRPKHDGFGVRVADSPLQGCAYAYGSAFSRALELSSPEAAPCISPAPPASPRTAPPNLSATSRRRSSGPWRWCKPSCGRPPWSGRMRCAASPISARPRTWSCGMPHAKPSVCPLKWNWSCMPTCAATTCCLNSNWKPPRHEAPRVDPVVRECGIRPRHRSSNSIDAARAV